MKNITNFLISVVGLSLAGMVTFASANAQTALALPPPPPDIYKAPVATDFVSYTSPDKTFEVVFRGKPKHKETDGDSARTCVTFTINRAAFSIVSIYDYKSDFQMEKSQYLENYRSRILSREKTKIESEIGAESNGVKGTEFKINNYYVYEVVRLFIIGNRVFEIKSSAANWNTIGERTKAEFLTEANRFLNSFKILDNAH